jgi:hypothetical protein
MASPNTNFAGDLLSTTAQLLQDDLFDQILTKNATSALLKENGQVTGGDWGISIAIPIMYAENGSYSRYSGSQQLNTSSNEVFSVFQYNPCQVALNVQANGREIHQNMGKAQNRNLVKSRFMNAKTTFENQFNIDLLSAGLLANQIGGLQQLISADGTGTVGGVSRSAFSFAKNQFYRATTDGGAALSASNIITYMDRLDVLLQTYKANITGIISDNASYQFYEATVHPLQRLAPTEGTLGKLGFRTYQYKQAEVVLEPTASGMPASTQYWIDPEVLELCYYNGRNLTRLDTRYSYNQDAQIEYLAWMGNLTAKNFRRLGTLNNA